MHDTLILERVGGLDSPDGAQLRSLAASDCKATQHQASVLGAVHVAKRAGKLPKSDVMQLHAVDGKRDASFSDAATSTAACARSANAEDDEASPQLHESEAGAKTNTTADTLTNQHMSTDAVNSEQHNQQPSSGAVWQLSAASKQQANLNQQHKQNPEHLVKMLFAAALHNGVCKPQQQVSHQQASFSNGSLISPASCMQLQLLQQQQQVLGSLLQPAAVLQQAAVVPNRVAALPTVSSTGQLAGAVAQPALVALPQCPPFMVALAPMNGQLATAAVQHQQPSNPPQQPLQANQTVVPVQVVAPAPQQPASPRAMHAAMGDRAFYSIRSLLLAQQDMFVQQLYELHRLARVQSLAWAEVMPARSPQTAPGASGSADVKSSSQASKHQQLTMQYGAGALAAVRSASARSKASNVSASMAQKQQLHEVGACDLATSKRGSLSEPALAGGLRNPPMRSSSTRAWMSSAQQYHQEQAGGVQAHAGAFAVTDAAALAADDVGAAAVADLPVHVVLLANIPSAMRKAVSQPRIGSNFARLNPAQYYARRDAGMLRPTAMRYMGDPEAAVDAAVGDVLAGSFVRTGSLAAVLAAADATAAGTSCAEPSMHPGALGLCDDIINEPKYKALGRRAAAPAAAAPDTHQPAQRTGKRPPQRSTTTRSLSSKRYVQDHTEAASDAAAAAAHLKGVVYDSDRGLQPQQCLQMPPPPPMLPELAAQHFAAAAAQQHFLQLQLQQMQQAAEHQECDVQQAESPEDLDTTATAAAGQPSGGLNVFRPMPQINPLLAPRFLAGGANAMDGLRPADAATAAAQFDPHSYWMSKHYGAAAAAAVPTSQQPWPQQPGMLDTAAVAGYGLNPVGMDAAAHVYGSMETGGLANVAAAAAAAAAEAAAASMGAAGSCSQQYGASAAPVHWWQDAQATFGDIGLIDPDALPPRASSRGGSRSRGSAGNKRWLPQQQAHSKKRSKHGAAAYGDAGQANGWQYDMMDGPEGYLAGTPGLLGGAFKPPAHPTQERSRVRSNAMGVSSRQELSVGSDNSASSIDNPAHAAAAAAAAAAELGPDAAEGVMLLHHMRSKMRGHAASGGRGGRGRMASGASRAAAEMSCQGSGVVGNHHLLDTSAAGILMSLSNSKSTVD